jgi:hypothetical protein
VAVAVLGPGSKRDNSPNISPGFAAAPLVVNKLTNHELKFLEI